MNGFCEVIFILLTDNNEDGVAGLCSLSFYGHFMQSNVCSKDDHIIEYNIVLHAM